MEGVWLRIRVRGESYEEEACSWIRREAHGGGGLLVDEEAR